MHPFAGTVNKSYNFEQGLNVVYGHNEAGKSSIVKALLLVLLTPTNLTKTEIKSQVAGFIPIGGDTINIDLKFEVDGNVYELKKSWGVNNISSLNKIGEAGINDADKVQAELFTLLKLNKSAVRDVIFTTQAKIASTVESITKDKDLEVVNSLDQILRGAILNTEGINPEKLKQQLTAEFEKLTNNWQLNANSPLIKENNKGSFENRWSKGVGEILELAYKLYDKEKALGERLSYDEKFTRNANGINELKIKVNNDNAFIESNAPLVESLTKRKEINIEIEKITKRKKDLKDIQTDWNAINANLPLINASHKSDNEQLTSLKQEFENARLALDAGVKISQFENIRSLKYKFEQAQLVYNDVKVVTDKDVAFVKTIVEPLEKAKAALAGLEAAQKFVVNIQPKANFEVTMQHSSGVSEKTNLKLGENISLEVNKGFLYSSADVTIEVKSLTDQINELNKQIEELDAKFYAALAELGIENYQILVEFNEQYNGALSLYQSTKSNYENSIIGSSYDQLAQEVEKINNLPKTRSVDELEILINNLIGKIATDKIEIEKLSRQKASYEATYETLDKVDELRIEEMQKETAANLKLNQLPTIDQAFDIEKFREEYRTVQYRLNGLETNLKTLELERATLEGGQPEVLASELQDEIELLERQKNQKIEEAKAIEKVINKLVDILGRTPVNPYQAYEQNLSQYLITLSGGKYEVTANNKLTPNNIKNVNTNLALPIDLLSQGTAGVLGLSLRLAMADYYLEGQNGFLAFDDPMVDFDENRQVFAAQCLQEYSNHKQVLIFTCHQSHASQLGGNLLSLN